MAVPLFFDFISKYIFLTIHCKKKNELTNAGKIGKKYIFFFLAIFLSYTHFKKNIIIQITIDILFTLSPLRLAILVFKIIFLRRGRKYEKFFFFFGR